MSDFDCFTQVSKCSFIDCNYNNNWLLDLLAAAVDVCNVDMESFVMEGDGIH